MLFRCIVNTFIDPKHRVFVTTHCSSLGVETNIKKVVYRFRQINQGENQFRTANGISSMCVCVYLYVCMVSMYVYTCVHVVYIYVCAYMCSVCVSMCV